jgi:para-nitrobenzyl esterase
MNALSRRTRILAALLCAGLSCSSAMAADVDLTSPLNVTGGAVAGVRQGDLSVFKGIPFAAPPVRELRWRAPAPVVPWQGVRITDRYSPMCLQALRSKNSVFYLGEETFERGLPLPECLVAAAKAGCEAAGHGVRVWRWMDDRVRLVAAVFR